MLVFLSVIYCRTALRGLRLPGILHRALGNPTDSLKVKLSPPRVQLIPYPPSPLTTSGRGRIIGVSVARRQWGGGAGGRERLSLHDVRLLMCIFLHGVREGTPPLKEFKARWQRKKARCIAHLSGAQGSLPETAPHAWQHRLPQMPGASTYSLDILEEDAHPPATAGILELGDHLRVILSLVILGRNAYSLLTSMLLNKRHFL